MLSKRRGRKYKVVRRLLRKKKTAIQVPTSMHLSWFNNIICIREPWNSIISPARPVTLTSNQVEACRKIIARRIRMIKPKGSASYYSPLQFTLPLTVKSKNSRMGKGKGKISSFVARVNALEPIFVLRNVPSGCGVGLANKLRHKLPVKLIVSRYKYSYSRNKLFNACNFNRLCNVQKRSYVSYIEFFSTHIKRECITTKVMHLRLKMDILLCYKFVSMKPYINYESIIFSEHYYIPHKIPVKPYFVALQLDVIYTWLNEYGYIPEYLYALYNANLLAYLSALYSSSCEVTSPMLACIFRELLMHVEYLLSFVESRVIKLVDPADIHSALVLECELEYHRIHSMLLYRKKLDYVEMLRCRTSVDDLILRIKQSNSIDRLQLLNSNEKALIAISEKLYKLNVEYDHYIYMVARDTIDLELADCEPYSDVYYRCSRQMLDLVNAKGKLNDEDTADKDLLRWRHETFLLLRPRPEQGLVYEMFRSSVLRLMLEWSSMPAPNVYRLACAELLAELCTGEKADVERVKQILRKVCAQDKLWAASLEHCLQGLTTSTWANSNFGFRICLGFSLRRNSRRNVKFYRLLYKRFRLEKWWIKRFLEPEHYLVYRSKFLCNLLLSTQVSDEQHTIISVALRDSIDDLARRQKIHRSPFQPAENY